ncbi:unnamed protein product [Nezara viridula]|uniref:Uncharacterized protein n=1 Tax=Nezara viridula TaxID=85310 RepID=A0A9P0E9M5_NEZVI|nr:unnamed protein product [Nezara viridula]
MDQQNYKFRNEVLAHSNDVRAISVMDNAIVSGSRDMTGKVWAESRMVCGFQPSLGSVGSRYH